MLVKFTIRLKKNIYARLSLSTYNTFLHFAQRENHGTEVFQLLLKRVADQDNERLRNALGVAIQIDCLEVVQLLLNKRVNINLSVGEYDNALQAAAYHDRIGVMYSAAVG